MTTILLSRDGALGDVLLTTPIVRRLAEAGHKVWVQTKVPEVYKNNPYVKRVWDVRSRINLSGGRDFKKFDLNLCYEKTPKMHIIDAYSKAVFGDTETPHKVEMFHTSTEMDRVSHLVKSAGLDLYKSVIVHPGVGWENRTFTKEFWEDMYGRLLLCFDSVISVGTNTDHRPSLFKNIVTRRIVSMHTMLSPVELSYLCYGARLFIGPDSGPLMVAQSSNTPCVGLFTCARAEYRVVNKDTVRVVHPALDCYGCLHDAPPPVVHIGCRRGDFACVRGDITVDMVMDAVRGVVE